MFIVFCDENIYLSAERICVHHRLQACNGSFLTLRFVLLRNCFREPDDMYSVMKITWNNSPYWLITVAQLNWFGEQYDLPGTKWTNFVCAHPWFVVMRVRPVPVELHDVGVLELSEVFEYELDFFLLILEVLPFRELDFVPNYLDSLFRVHGQISAIDAGDIPLFHLEQKKNNYYYYY